MSLPSLLVNQSGCNKTILCRNTAQTKGPPPKPLPWVHHACAHACMQTSSKLLAAKKYAHSPTLSIACVCYEVGRPCQACCEAMPAVGSDRCWCSLASQRALSTAVFM